MQNPFPTGDDNLAPDSGRPQAARSLQSLLTRALAAFGLLPLLLVGALSAGLDYRTRVDQAELSLRATVEASRADLDLFLSTHLSAVRLVAAEIDPVQADEEALVRKLERTRSAFPALRTMLITNVEGRIVAGSFDNRTGIVREIWFDTDVSDRAYFRVPRDTGEPSVTASFRGRGFGEDVLCGVSAPMVDPAGQFAGVAQGSIAVEDLGLAFRAASAAAGLALVVLDPEQKVAWASPELELELLASAPAGLLGADEQPSFRAVQIAALPAGDSLVAAGDSRYGWQVLALLPRRALLERALLDSAVVLVSLLLIALLALLAGRRFAARLLKPIQAIGTRMDGLSLARHPERYRSEASFSELAKLEGSFMRLGERLADSRRQLQAEWDKESSLRLDLAAARAASERSEGELDAARDIQMSLLPSRRDLARIDDRFDVAALLEPMSAVGGDFFNVMPLDGRRLVFFVGDVADKGVPAALLMSRAVTLLEAAAVTAEAPSAMLGRVGAVLGRDNDSGMFVTVLIGVIHLDSGECVLASAGHEPPLLRRHDGRVESVPLQTGPALGFDEHADYPEFLLQLEPGDLLMAYTDGVTEVEDAQGRAFGEQGIARQLELAKPQLAAEAVDAVADAVDSHRAGAPRDDLTVLCLRRARWASTTPAGRLELEAGAAGEPLQRLLDELQSRLQAAGVETAPSHDARLLVDEVLSNAYDHGSDGALRASVDYRVLRDRLSLVIEDNSRPFDPLAQNLPDVDLPLAERSIGGLGLLLLHTIAREPHYARSEGRNRLSLWLPRSGD
jgi:serine phosphatase RsbU (regulator of sigma subunit)/anti-sigma regulatory factor (Ser/Thr protein kinase)